MTESFRNFRPLRLFLGLALIVPLISIIIVQLNGRDVQKQAFDNLNSIAALKAGQIENWLGERQLDLEFLAAGEGFAFHAERLALTGNPDSRAIVTRRLEAYSKARYYQAAVLLDAAGQVIVATGEHADFSAPVTQQLLQSALKSGKITRSDLYRDAIVRQIHFDYVLPLPGTGGRQPVAAVLLHAHAESFLFPLIQTWPTPSPSAETLLVRRDGNDALFLNELRYRRGAALSLRLPLSATQTPAVAAVLGDKALAMEGVDYRGVAVFAAARPIAGTPWRLVAKIDREEVMAPLKALIRWISLVTFIAAAIITAIIWRLWRQVQHTQQLELAAHTMAMHQESEQHFRTLANSGSTLIWTSGLDRLCNYFNEPWLRFTGRSLEQELGNGWAEGVHPDDSGRCRETYVTAFDQRKPFSIEYRLRHADGSYRWIRDDGNPRYDSQGAFLGYIGFCVDITEQKEIAAELEKYRLHLEDIVAERTFELEAARNAAESSHRFLKTITDAFPSMVGYWSDELRCGFANIAYQTWFGRSPEEMLGIRMQDMMSEALFRKNEPYVLAALRGEPQRFERPLVKADNSIGYISALYIPDVTDGRVRGFFVLVNDITELKKAQFELEVSNEALNARTLEAEAASRAKSIFLANMSHELRTPLNAILGFSDILRRDAGLSESQKENLTIIHKSGDHLLNLINDVLDIAKIEAGRAVLEAAPFDAIAMLADVAGMLRIRAQEKGLHFQVEQSSRFPRYLVGDEAKLRQILINLISNAIKATEEGGVILRLKLKRKKTGNHLLIEVEDTGVGIAAEDQAEIFEAFVQLGSPGKQLGTGLGLSIVRQFVELMGGNITLTSKVGQGSTFRAAIPVQLARPEDIRQASVAYGEVTALAPGQPACRVLVVEDLLENRLLLVRLLESVGFDVRLAENGIEAVVQFTCWHPHFIWMDQRMPLMDGMETTRRIRALPGGEAAKIAAVTAFSLKNEDNELMAAGIDAIIHKPFRPEQVFGCMERLLGPIFIRAQAGGDAQSPELSAAAMAALPASLRQNLAQALLMLNGERILEAIDEIAETAPELADALRWRAENYDYPPILALLQSNSAVATSASGMPLEGTPA